MSASLLKSNSGSQVGTANGSHEYNPLKKQEAAAVQGRTESYPDKAIDNQKPKQQAILNLLKEKSQPTLRRIHQSSK